MKMTLTLKAFEVWEGEEKDLEVEVEYSPGRPAPRCSNPDDARFSDPGDPDELEIISAVILIPGGRILVSGEMMNSDRFNDAVLEAARDHFDGLGRGED